MEDIDKTKDELIAELELLRSEVAALQQAGRSQSATGLPPTASAVATLTLPDSLGLATRPEATGQYTILFVDDSEVDRATYRRFLLQDSDRTYNIVEFDNGEDALQWCQHQIPDILLLDYYLPDIDGLELLEELLQQTGRNTLPAIVLTGQGNLQIAVDLLKSGAQDYLEKSQITPEVLQRSISYVLRHTQLMREREWQRQQQQIVAKTALAIRDSLKLEDILNTTVTEIRNILLCDRVIIFQLAPDLSGRVVVESVGSEARPILSTQIHDPCLSESYFERFRQGLVTAKSDIHRAQIAPCHLEFLTNLQVRANLVVPILQGENLWGLLIAHHCVAPREWQASEIELLRQLSAQASIAIQQADLLEQLQTELRDRKQAELTLQETQEKLQLFIKYAPASIVMFDRSMCYLAASQRWVDEYLLNDLESIIGRSHYELFPNIPEEWKQFHQRGFAGFIEKCDEDRFVHSDGSLQWLRWEIHPWYRSNGDVGGIILFTEDITDRKQAQIALQQINTELEKRVTERTAQLTEVNDRLLVTLLEKEHAYQLLKEQAQLLDLAHDSIITWHLNSVISFWNQGAELMYGWTKAEAFGQDSHSLFKTQFPQPLAEIQAELFETGYWEGELIHCTRDDRQITVSSRWVVQKDDAGRPIKILEINSDVTQRKAAELVLQQYIREVEDLYNNAPCGYHSLDAEGTMVRINDTELKWLGYTRDEMLYKIKFLDLLSPEGKQVFNENFPKLKQQGWVENLELEMFTKDGSSRWFNLNATAIEDAAGNFVMTRSTLFDISDRKQSQREREQAELALRESEEQRRLALEQKSRQESLLWTITQAIRQSLDLKDILNTAVTEVKQTLQVDRAAIYRFTPDWSGDFVVESVDPQWVKLVECNIQKACEDVYLQETKGGRFRNHETFAIADIDEAGLHPCHIQLLQQFQAKAYLAVPIFSGEFLWGLLIIYQNTAPRNWQSWEIELLEQISSQLAIAIQQSQLYTQLELELQERQQAEAIIREAERRWRSLLENVQLIVVGLDASGNINYVNPFFVGLTGYTHEEVLGKNWFENFLPSSSQPSTEADFLQLLTHTAHPYYRNAILTKSGEERFIAWNNTTLQDSDGTVIGSISIGEDITERNKIEQIKDEFIGIVSHELRTPLTAIQMSLGLLKTGIYDKKPEKSRRMIEIALLDTNRLVNLVNDILDLERLESGRAFLDKTLCKAADLMQQVVDALQAIANQHQISLIIIPTDAEVWAAADAILQTLTNLLSNALKFSPVGATIYLSAENQTDCVLFQVRDRGRGIPADKLELVFGRFQQVDASDSREKGGTGLGLPICRSIIEQHGGKIWAESILGEGSTFFFTLPLPAIE
jgi:PAS domain S-box-containing protein